MIPLTRRDGEEQRYALCSPEDFEVLSTYTWHESKRGYVVGTYDEKPIKMHRFVKIILQKETVPDGYVIDHMPPGDKLDNRREKLRIVTHKVNARNKKKRKGLLSSYYGVTMYKNNGKFLAKVVVDGVIHNIGIFEVEIQAARAYDSFLMSLSEEQRFGYNLNFPDMPPVELPKKRVKQCSYRGVKRTKYGFTVGLIFNKKSLVRFNSKSEIECARKYDETVVLHKLDKKLNFPEEYPDYVPDKIIKTEKISDDGFVVQCKVRCGPEIVLVDSDVYETIVKFSKIHIDKEWGHARITHNKKTANLHRVIMNETDPKVIIDHIDRNKLNNLRANLRRTDAQGNAENKSKRKNRESSYIGVTARPAPNTFAAIVRRKKFKYYKKHKSEEHAARDRDLVIMTQLPDSNFPLAFTWTDEDIAHWKTVLKKE